MARPYSYSQVQDQPETEKEGSSSGGNTKSSWHRSKATWMLVVSHVALFIFGLILSRYVGNEPRQSLQSGSSDHQHLTAMSTTLAYQQIDGFQVVGTQCGDSWQEAKAKGCQFDVMASRWYAPECFDKEVLDDMLAEPQVNWNFTWYEDQHHTVVVPSEKVLSGEFDKVYPDNLFHIKHCLHLWRKLHHAVITKRPVDEDILDYGHTLHCTRMIMEWTSPGFERLSVTSAKSATPFCRSDPVGLLIRNNM